MNSTRSVLRPRCQIHFALVPTPSFIPYRRPPPICHTPHHPPRWEDLMCPLVLLHDRLVLLTTIDSPLAVQATACFELAWHVDMTGREALVAQTLPYLVALALTFGSSSRLVLYPPPSCSMMRYSCSATTMTRASLTLRCSCCVVSAMAKGKPSGWGRRRRLGMVVVVVCWRGQRWGVIDG